MNDIKDNNIKESSISIGDLFVYISNAGGHIDIGYISRIITVPNSKTGKDTKVFEFTWIHEDKNKTYTTRERFSSIKYDWQAQYYPVLK